MKKEFLLVFVLISIVSFSYGEIVVVDNFKSASFIYPTHTMFFSEILLSIYGGNKYGAGIVLSPSSSSNFQDVQINLEKVEFFTRPFDFLDIYFWYGVRKYVGYESTYQGYIYHPSKEFSFKGWRWISGTGVDLDFSFFDKKLNANLYVYRPALTNEGGISSDLEVSLVYRDVLLSGFLGISEASLRSGLMLKTLFRTMNAVFVLGVDSIPLTNISINPANVYALGEERVSVSSSDNSWGVEQIFSIMLKPQFYNGFIKPNDISDLDIRLTGVLRFLNKVLVGAEGLMYIYNLTGSAVTQLYIEAWAGPVIGILDNNVSMNIKPSFILLSTRTNQVQQFYKVVLSGEVRF
jgi:hypothetical protein